MKTDAMNQRWWDLPAALLLLAAFITAATRLVATRWTTHLSITQTLVLYGIILGLALGQSRFSARIAGLFAFLYGAFFVPLQLGLTLKNQSPWLERLSILYNRLELIIGQILQQETVRDSLLFLVLMSILFWALSIYAGFVLVRHGNAWQALLPGGLTLFVLHSFDDLLVRRAWYLAVFIFFSLILIARITFLQRQNRWQTNRTALPPHLGLDFIRFTILASSLIVLFAWTVPALANALPTAQKAWQPVREAWYETRDRFDNAFASLRSSYTMVGQFYGRSTNLGRGNPLSDAQMLTINAPPNMPPGIRLYWRARTYETYLNGQWFSTLTSNYPFDPEVDNLQAPLTNGRWFGVFDFITAANLSTLITPPQPLWVSRPGQVEYVENSDGTVDISTFRASPSLEPGQSYSVQASISYPSIKLLQEAGSAYPEWVTERYLELPESITPRTKQLAEDITSGLETPYDKVVAVTNYLRRNINYVDTIDEYPADDQDIIDWFLFDYKQGFCNYYSTAEIVLLRSIGIPTRWAVGYAQGERVASDLEAGPGAQFEEATFVVRQRDAHAWPEVYFPGVGWVEFEPTASQPEIIRLEGNENEAQFSNTPPSNLDDIRDRERDFEELMNDRDSGFLGSRQARSSMVYWLTILSLGGGLLILFYRFRHRLIIQPTPILLEATLEKFGIHPPKIVRLWARRAKLPPLVRAYEEINRALSRLDMQPAPTETPSERALSLGRALPPTKRAAIRLVAEYEIGTFSTRPPNMAIALSSSNDIKRLSFRAYIGNFITRLKKLIPWSR